MQQNNCSKNLIKNFFIKALVIFIVGFVYTVMSASAKVTTINNLTTKAPGICVFDIDFTLKCKGAYAAVSVCKDAGFGLAINTARNKKDAIKVLYDGTLVDSGFSHDFIETAKKQNKLNGPFQYKQSWSFNQTEEQKYHNKSFGMRNIANFYNIKLNDFETRKIVLFDDMLHNILQMKPSVLEPYYSLRCKLNSKGDCYFNPDKSPKSVNFPRNWKIYNSKWIGYLCNRWDNPQLASEDAMEVVYDILTGEDRELISKDIIDMSSKNSHLNND